jgi:carnitine O-acetyltransferase
MLHGTYRLSPEDQQTGSCCNRWYDKLQIIVCGDGTAGVNFEHSAIDGHTALRFVSDIVAETIVVFAQSITKLVHGIGHVPHVIDAQTRRAALTLDASGAPTLDVFPKKLIFDLPNNVLDKIFYAETALGDEIVASDTVVLEFQHFGKSLIVANSMSPDAFVQMSMMLAYYRLYGKIVCTYEPVLTKVFYHGRTEAQRPATPEAAQFCKIWCSQSTETEKLDALRVATREHSRLVKEAAQGKGIDRHLFALKCIVEHHKMPMPKFFQSKPWSTLNHTILSTSNCGNPALRLFGFGPVVADGFGVGYIIKDDALSYSVSSKRRQTDRYVNMLRRTLSDFKELLKPINVMEVGGNGILAAAGRHDSLKNTKPPVPQETETYDDFFGESDPAEVASMSTPRPLEREDKAATSYFSVVRRKPSIKGNLLSRIGLHVKLSSGDTSDD